MKLDHKFTNGLINETSPYLLQHAHNPVDWHPWGEAAFQKARQEDKPVFLSIGYSTCHWCHVMERESFENEAVAQVINAYFIPIKVDREERPDIDHLYMTFAHAMNAQGGWPLNVFTDPEGRPFYAATYIPPKAQYGRIGIRELAEGIHEAYQEHRDELLEFSQRLIAGLKTRETASGEKTMPDETAVAKLGAYLQSVFDETNGGFSGAPKFPSPQNLLFLLHSYELNEDDKALAMAETTLLEMYRGGIYDHVGGGFSRYSTDDRWLVPHFEKMLYDNGLLLQCYLTAFEITGKPIYQTIALDIIDYLLREMKSPQGLFYSATDADSEGVEGKYFLWRRPEALAITQSETFLDVYGIRGLGNFEGANILNLQGQGTERIPDEELSANRLRFEGELNALRQGRNLRIKPLLDDKIITAWNAMVIKALSEAGRILGDTSLALAAQTAMDQLLDCHAQGDSVIGSSRQGKAGPGGTLDDYAYLCDALINLYRNSFQETYLLAADKIMKLTLQKFWDGGSFTLADRDNQDLLINLTAVHDGAIPSGAAMAYRSLAALSALTYNSSYLNLAEEFLLRNSEVINEYPQAVPTIVDTLNAVLNGVTEVVLCGEEKADLLEKYGEFLSRRRLGQFVLVVDRDSALKDLDPFFTTLATDQDTLYICWDFDCRVPVKGYVHIMKSLDELSGR